MKNGLHRKSRQALTPRELAVLRYLAKGNTKAEVGVCLDISSYTVDFHVRGILRKLDARNIAAAMFAACCRGLFVSDCQDPG